jgi:hypothetical protein
MSGHSKGGNDTFSTEGGFNTFYGAAGGNMSDHSKGGNDSFTAVLAGEAFNVFCGDAGGNLSGHAQGGNDSFTTSVNTFYGDAGGEMSDFARGGDDVAVFSGISDDDIQGTNDATGDAFTMSGHAVGGNDTLTGGDARGSAVDADLASHVTTFSGAMRASCPVSLAAATMFSPGAITAALERLTTSCTAMPLPCPAKARAATTS